MPGDAVVLDPSSDRSRPGVLATVRSHAIAIVVGLVVGALLGYSGSSFLPTRYTAEASIFLDVDGPFTAGEEASRDAVRFAADQAELVVTTDVLLRAANRLVPPVPVKEVRESVTAEAATATSRVTVTVVRPEAESARALADAVVTSYRELAGERVASAALLATQAVTDPIVAQEIRLRAAAYGDGVATVEPAELPDAASAPLPLQNALVGGLIGLFLVTGVFLLRDQRRAGRASVADLDLMLGAPLLARYPSPGSRALPDMVTADPSSDRFRAGNDVLTAIDVALEGVRRPSVLFLSWQNPLSTTALGVTVALAGAREGRPVVLVDGGAKERGISFLADVDPGRGLEGLANHATPVAASLRTWRVARTELGVVPLNEWSPTPASAAARPQVLRAATERLKETAALTLVDGPPLTERSLGLALGRGVDGVVLVIDENTSTDTAQEMGRHVGLAGVSVLGYVLVRPPRRRVIPRGNRRERWSNGIVSAHPVREQQQVVDPDRVQDPGHARA